MYKLNFVHDKNCQRLEIGFLAGAANTNAEYVSWVEERLSEMIEAEPMRGNLLKINGAASLPIAAVIIHKVAHLYGAVAVFDPKLSGYVVTFSHNPEYTLGMILTDEPIIV